MASTRTTTVWTKNAPHPSTCLKCGTYARTMIDFAVTQPWNGACLVCVECLRAIIIENQELLRFLDEDAAISSFETMKSAMADIEKVNRLQGTKLSNFDGAITHFKENFDAVLDTFKSDLIDGTPNASVSSISDNFELKVVKGDKSDKFDFS